MTHIRLSGSLSIAVAFGIVCAIGFAGIASAETPETAEAALGRGKAAMKAGRIAEACTAFAASVRLDPEISSRLLLAKCYEQDGKIVSAARAYRDAAEDDGNTARGQASLAKASKLEARAPRLRLALTSRPAGLVVRVDGVEVPSTEDVLVDVGPHEVVATAPGYTGRASAPAPVDRERAILDVIVRLEPIPELERAASPAPVQTAIESEPDTTEPSRSPSAIPTERASSHRKRNGMIIGGAGVALLTGAALLFVSSSDKFGQEQALCPESRCANDADLARARELISQSRMRRGLSIGMGIGGGLALAVGAYLVLTPSKEEPPVSVQVDGDGASVAYTIGF